MKKPQSSSTPKWKPMDVRRRRGIHDQSIDSTFSPIPPAAEVLITETSSVEPGRTEEESVTEDESFTEDENITDDNNVTPSSSLHQPSDTSYKRTVIISLLTVLVLCVSIHAFVNSVKNERVTLSLSDLQRAYPLQSQDVWSAVESGVRDVVSFNRPSMFLFVYSKKAEKSVNGILTNVSQYASCILNENCSVKPVLMSNRELNRPHATEDYGVLISHYKPQIEDSKVVVVKNLDQVPSSVAQIFHSMCDEYTPLVSKAAYFFTMQLDQPGKDLASVETVLRKNWGTLKDDIFHPLFTRISSMVLRIVPEK